ncbi:MAG: FAD-binding protein [Burkholderiaceae bacterium]|nr:MAG: FAD-binding protein [Burkholderiaceae bacterium]
MTQRVPLPSSFITAMQALLGERFTQSPAWLAQHGRDESPFEAAPPDAIAWPLDEAEVQAILRACDAHAVPVIARGAGTSLEGHLLAVHGGLSLDMSRMNAVLEISADNMLVRVQPGVTRLQLQQALKDSGVFFPVDPGADASLGGMVNTRASGTNAVRYGTMKELVLALRAVTAKGELLQTGSQARKSSAGYDLTRLIVGSEGTLAVVTEITLRLFPVPEGLGAAIVSFPTIDAACQTAMAVIQSGLPIARCELLDVNAVRAVNQRDRLELPESPLLLMEFQGTPQQITEQAEWVGEISQEWQGSGFQWAIRPEERNRLWAARHHAYHSAIQQVPGCRAVTTDACVPISRLADCINASVQDVEEAGLPHFIVGHVGDGNFHLAYLIDPSKPEQMELAEHLNARLVRRAQAMGGTCTGEHGVGLHKKAFLQEEAGETGVTWMRAIKQALDPKGILNPGKIF